MLSDHLNVMPSDRLCENAFGAFDGVQDERSNSNEVISFVASFTEPWTWFSHILANAKQPHFQRVTKNRFFALRLR